MPVNYRQNGHYSALQKLGVYGTINTVRGLHNARPQKEIYTSATGDSGTNRARIHENPKTQVNTGFNEFDRAYDRDTQMDSSQFSVGSGQSTTNKIGKVAEHKSKSSPLYESIMREAKSHKKIRFIEQPSPSPTTNWGYVPPGSIRVGRKENPPIIITNPTHKSPYFLAHELGHHQWGETTLGKILQHPKLMQVTSRYNPIIPALIGVSAASKAGKHLKGTEKEKVKDDVRLKATAAATIPLAPRYLSETAANAYGTKTFAKHYMRLSSKHRTFGTAARGFGGLLLSQGSYTLAYGAPLLGAVYGPKLRKYLHPKKKK